MWCKFFSIFLDQPDQLVSPPSLIEFSLVDLLLFLGASWLNLLSMNLFQLVAEFRPQWLQANGFGTFGVEWFDGLAVFGVLGFVFKRPLHQPLETSPCRELAALLNGINDIVQLLFRVALKSVIQLELMAVVTGQVNSHVVINHFRLLLFTEALRYHELILYKLFRYCDILNLINLIIYYGQKVKTLNNYCLLKI